MPKEMKIRSRDKIKNRREAEREKIEEDEESIIEGGRGKCDKREEDEN